VEPSIFDSDELNASLFFPRGDDDDAPPDATEIFVDVGGGVAVHVRRHAAPEARCDVLLFHGNGEIVGDYDGAARLFARCGGALVAADYRGYGKSDGAPTLRAVIDDARTIATAVRGDRPLVVFGRSLGGAAAHELYARPIDGMVGVVLESTYFDPRGLILRRGMRPPASFTDEERRVFMPESKLRAGTLPLLILHGADDTLIVPSEATSAIAAAGSADKRLVLIEDRGHNDIATGDGYWDALADFIGRVSAG
jgi:alpha-beta hydrolase superfamily lysophospholipase